MFKIHLQLLGFSYRGKHNFHSLSLRKFSGENNRRSIDLPDADKSAAAPASAFDAAAVGERTAADAEEAAAPESSKLSNSDARGLSR